MTPAEEAFDLVRQIITNAKIGRGWKLQLKKLTKVAKKDEEARKIYRHFLTSVQAQQLDEAS